MRPLYFDHPEDPNVWATSPQWMLGDDLLVAPVLEAGALTWPVYLPAGRWVDVWTGDEFEGGVSIAVDAPLDVIPVFARAESGARLLSLFTRQDQ
jgi:alpha-glucosidase (family GH31 glycosyl hydrolase)